MRSREDGLEIVLTVVVEYGLKLSEVAASIQDRVRYEVERITGLGGGVVEVQHRRREALLMDIETVRVRARRRCRTSRRTALASTGSTSIRCPTATPAPTSRSTLRAVVEALDASTAIGRGRRRPRALARRPDGRTGQLGGHPQPDRARSRERARASTTARRPVMARAFRPRATRVPGVLRPVEGTMLTVIREMAEEAEWRRRPARSPARSCSRRSSTRASTRSRGRRRCCRCCRGRGRRRRWRGAGRDHARCPPLRGRAAAAGGVGGRGGPSLRRSTTSSRCSVLHQLRRSGRRRSTATPRQSRRVGDSLHVVGDSSLCASTSTPTIRTQRSPSRSVTAPSSSRPSMRPTCTSRFASSCSSRATSSRRSSPSPPARATDGRSSACSARSGSSAAARPRTPPSRSSQMP